MKKKCLYLLLCLILLISITGCNNTTNESSDNEPESKESDSKKTNKKEKENDSQNTKEKESEAEKVNEKSISCTYQSSDNSQDGIEYTQSFVFDFVDDNIETINFISNIKMLEETEETKEYMDQLNEETLKEGIDSLYEYLNEENPEFDIKVETISSTEKKITMTITYQDYLKITSDTESDNELSEYTTFTEMYEHIKEITDEDATCTYNGQIIE